MKICFLSKLCLVMIIIFSFSLPTSAFTFSQDLTEEENVSVIYDSIFNHFLHENHRLSESVFVFYKDTGSTIDTLSIEEKIVVAGLNVWACQGTAWYDSPYIPISTFQKTYKRLFGEDLPSQVLNQTYQLNDMQKITFTSDNVLYEPIFYSTPSETRGLCYVEKYEIVGDTLFIYDKFALIDISEANNGVAPVYSSINKTRLLGYINYDEGSSYCETDNVINLYLSNLSKNIPMEWYPANRGNYFDDTKQQDLFDRYNDLLSEYKHTFRKDASGNWYWFCSEPISGNEPNNPNTAETDIIYPLFAIISAIFATGALIHLFNSKST